MKSRATTCILTAIAVVVAWPAAAAAQVSGDGFLFESPTASLSLNGGFARASAGSQVFSDITDLLTVDRGDFDAFSAGGSLAVALTPRLDIALDVQYAGSTTPSESRGYVFEDDDSSIEQTTQFRRVPATLNLKYYVTPRGRSIGSLAWVPNRYALYVGAGGGLVWYRLHQWGDFVDAETLVVDYDDYESSGAAPAAQGFAGIDVSLTEHIVLSGEARYLWSNDDLSRDFQGYDPIDLSGISAVAGISLRI